jgi:hypothetical protein
VVFSGTKVGLINARMSRNRGKRRKRSDRRRWCVLVVEVVGKAAGVAAGMVAAEGVKEVLKATTYIGVITPGPTFPTGSSPRGPARPRREARADKLGSSQGS